MSTDYEKAVDALMKDVKELRADMKETLTKDVKDLRADMKDVIAAIKAKAGDYVDDAKDSLHESAAHRVKQVREAADALKGKCQDGLKSCAAKIEEHPFACVLAALGVGLVLGALMRCHRR